MLRHGREARLLEYRAKLVEASRLRSGRLRDEWLRDYLAEAYRIAHGPLFVCPSSRVRYEA